MSLALACRTPGFAAGIFGGKVPFSLPRGAVLQKSVTEAGSYQPPRHCLLWTPGILILVFVVQKHQPSDPLRAPVVPVCPASPLDKQSQRLREMLEAARDDGKGGPCQLQYQKKRNKRARLTSLLPPFPLTVSLVRRVCLERHGG